MDVFIYLYIVDLYIVWCTIKSLQDCELLQQDLDRLVQWSEKWLMKFNVQKCTSMSVHKLQ